MTAAVFNAVAQPMGLQRYELEILRAIAGLDGDFILQPRSVGTLRSSGADVRIPAFLRGDVPWAVARLLGLHAYGRGEVHRFDLRLPPAPGPEVVTVHDLPPLRFSDEGVLPEWSLRSARRARLVLSPSSFAAQEAQDLLHVPDVVVVPNGVHDIFFNAKGRGCLDFRPAASAYFLHVGGATERKNLSALAMAWDIFTISNSEAHLVMVGPPDSRRNRLFDSLPRVRMAGFRQPEDVATIMADAVGVIVPSRYEGFGLPALEAMAAGTPVIASNTGALPEVCGDAALMVGAHPHELAEAMAALWHDHGLRADLAAKGRIRASAFTWEAAARGHLDAYRRAFG